MDLGVYDRVHQEIGDSDRSGWANHSGGHWQGGERRPSREMRILATGSAGHLGEALMRTLEHSDHVYIAVYPIGHTSTNTRDLDWDGNAARLQQQHPTT